VKWLIAHTLESIESILVSHPNTSELEYLLGLKKQLEQKLQELEQEEEDEKK
jgi:hypothetical protein